MIYDYCNCELHYDSFTEAVRELHQLELVDWNLTKQRTAVWETAKGKGVEL